MDDIIDRIYNYDKNLFMEKIYEPWIRKLKIKSKISIKQKTCTWCHEVFTYKIQSLCIECLKDYNII